LSEKIRLVRWEDSGVHGDWATMWPAFAQAYDELVSPGPPASEPGLRDELLFCLLGGHGITFEMNRSAQAVIAELDVFSERHGADALWEDLVRALSAPRFDPPRKDGSLRRYRFPRRKATLIVAARAWVLGAGSLTDQLAARACERDRRAWLMSCPGLGPKSASWVLRNTGWAHDLAILDIHVLRAMAEEGVIGEARLEADYEAVERKFLDWCRVLDAAPAVFDLFLWEWQRGTLRPATAAAAAL
jgi:thermostable 8-oxoguanine DNA glycosylase